MSSELPIADLTSAQQRRSHLIIYEAGVTQVNEMYEWGKETKMTLIENTNNDIKGLPPPSPSVRNGNGNGNGGLSTIARWLQLPSSIDHESILITYMDQRTPLVLKRASWRPSEPQCKALINPLTNGSWIGEQVHAVTGEKETIVVGTLLNYNSEYVVLMNEKNGRVIIRKPIVIYRPEDKTLGTKCVKEASKGHDTVGIVSVVPSNLKRLQLTYLANHLQWKAKYTMIISPNLRFVYMLNSTACITNQTPNDMKNLTLSLISGDVNTERSQNDNDRRIYSQSRMMVASAESRASVSSLQSVVQASSSGNDRFDLKIAYQIPAHQTIETDFVKAPDGVGSAQPWFRYYVSENSSSKPILPLPYGLRLLTQTGEYAKLPSLPAGTWYIYSAAYHTTHNPLVSLSLLDEKQTPSVVGVKDFLGSTNMRRQTHVNGYIDIPIGTTQHFLGGHTTIVQVLHQSADYIPQFNRNRNVQVHASFSNQFDSKKMGMDGSPTFELRDYIVEIRYDTQGQKVELNQVQGRVKPSSSSSSSSSSMTMMKNLYPPPINRETRLPEPVSLFGNGLSLSSSSSSLIEQLSNINSEGGFIRPKGIENGQYRIWVGPIPEGETVELTFSFTILPEMPVSNKRS